MIDTLSHQVRTIYLAAMLIGLMGVLGSIWQAGQVSVLAQAQSATPWVESYPMPLRTFYVSPTGSPTADGTQTSPLDLPTAVLQAKAGDLYWLSPGSYIYPSNVSLKNAGTPTNPIVFRGQNGQVKIVSQFSVTGANIWLWGLEITNPTFVNHHDGTSVGAAVNVLAAGVHLINNTIHDNCDMNGVGGWNVGSGQVYYGNILYNNGCNPTFDPTVNRYRHPHNIYSQNDFFTNGLKYYVNNFIFEQGCSSGCFSMHVYTEGGRMSGFYMENNVVANIDPSNGTLRFLIGGTNKTVPEDHNTFVENYFYGSSVQIGYGEISQSEFRNNYLGKSPLSLNFFWSAGDTKFTKSVFNTITGNSFVNSPGATDVVLRTAAFTTATGATTPTLTFVTPKLDTQDTFNNNTYAPAFKGNLSANGVTGSGLTLSQWRAATTQAGMSFDAQSTETVFPTTAKVVVLPNEYDTSRIHLAIYNWGQQASVSVSLGSALPTGHTYQVLDAHNFYGAPLTQGTYNGSISIPTQDKEFLALVVFDTSGTAQGSPVPSPTPTACPTDINNDRVTNLSDYSLLVNDFLKVTLSNPRSDITGDGKVDLLDYSKLVSQFLKPCV